MSNNISADAGTDAMAAALTDAAADLESIANENTQLVDEFEQHGWSGLDGLSSGQPQINSVRDSLTDVADKIGVGGALVRDAHANNHMISNASKVSLGHE